MPGAIFGFPTRPTTGQGMVWNEAMGGAMAPGSFTLTGASLSGFGDNRLAFGSSTGGLEDDADLTYDGTTLANANTSGVSLSLSSTDTGSITSSGGWAMGRNCSLSRDFNGAVQINVTNTNAGTGADARNVLTNDAGRQTLFILGSTANTGTFFTGRSRANTMFVGSGSALDALCIGFIGQDKPIVFGSNSTEIGGWTSGVIASGSFQVLYSGQSALAVTGGATFGAATTSRSSIRLPHGTAPSSPVDGDMWTTTAGLYVRINGSTVGPLS